MDDQQVLDRIENLVTQERRLHSSHIERGLDEAERAELHRVEVQLDQAWDLLRQRRALRHAGMDPNAARERGEDVVEHYRQ
jgi:hypothetical protein